MSKFFAAILAFFGLGSPVHHAPPPPPSYLIVQSSVADEKAVFATIESANVVPARARIGGTIIELQGPARRPCRTRAGDRDRRRPEAGLAGQFLQRTGAGRAGAACAGASSIIDRAQRLIAAGAIAKNAYDQARTAYNVALECELVECAKRAVVQQQIRRGPGAGADRRAGDHRSGDGGHRGDAGRYRRDGCRTGFRAAAGDSRTPRPLHQSRAIRFVWTAPIWASTARASATIKLVYPADRQRPRRGGRDGRRSSATISSASASAFGSSAGQRQAIVVPANLIVTRSGIDYATAPGKPARPSTFRCSAARTSTRPMQRDGIEVLSGLAPGDRLLKP